MIGYLLAVIAVLAAAVALLWMLWRSASKDYARLAERNDQLADELESAKKQVAEVQSVYEKYEKKHSDIARGGVSDSVSILSDLARSRSGASAGTP